MSYDYWEAALADPKRLRARDFKITSDPQEGFYRTKAGKPVAIWQDYDTADGAVVMTLDGADVEPHNFDWVWMNCALRPVSEEWFRIVEGGGTWPDLDEGLAGMGDNVMAGMDEVDQIDELEKQVRAYREIEDDETAARAQSLRARLLELKKAIDTKREALKAPHLKAAREVDEIWMSPVKRAVGCANALRALIEGWETRKRRAAREAEAERLAAIEAEKQAFEKDFGTVKGTEAPKIAPDVPLTPPKDQIRAGYGRAASVREKRVVTGINDLTMALQRYGYADEVAEVLIKLAQQAVDRGQTQIPGFTIEVKALIR
jgi:hypothetical protein